VRAVRYYRAANGEQRVVTRGEKAMRVTAVATRRVLRTRVERRVALNVTAFTPPLVYDSRCGAQSDATRSSRREVCAANDGRDMRFTRDNERIRAVATVER